jgi:hypothetical protein
MGKDRVQDQVNPLPGSRYFFMVLERPSLLFIFFIVVFGGGTLWHLTKVLPMYRIYHA